MKKRLICIFFALCIALSCFPCVAASDTLSIKVQPAVFLCGRIYNIVWSTDRAAAGYVEYTVDGKTHRVYDEEAGVVRTDDYIHTVSVPTEELDAAGGYKVTSVAVDARTPYSASYGATCSVERTFTGYHGQEEINIWTLSDLHRTPTSGIMTAVNSAVSYLKGGRPDIVMLLGDICNDMQNKDYAEIGIFDTAAQLSGGEIPCVYTRGNHETRGEFSGYLLQYLPSDTGEFYFTFDYGPLSSVVLDFGEDKIDTHPEYSGLVDYSNYRIEETEWLGTVEDYSSSAIYRVAFCHGPNIIDHFGLNWLGVLTELGTDIMVSGHYHEITMWEPDGNKSDMCTDFPIMLDGSHVNSSGFNASQLILKDGKITCYGVSDSGEEKLSYEVTAGEKLKTSSLKGASPAFSESAQAEAVGETVITQALKGASADFGFITKPVVFDTGDTYTVAWATTEGKNSMGEVHLVYEGRERRFTDSEGGTLRCLSNLHAVRIPKKYLENNSYEVVSQQIIKHGAYSAVKGACVTSGYIKFGGYSGQTDIGMLAVSNLGGDRSMISEIRGTSADYDILVLGGNTLSNAADDSTVIKDLLYSAGMLTGGKLPTVFVRGENEILGEYAPYLTRIVRNSTRQFYESVEFGPVSVLVLDTAGLYPDASTQYNGLVSFDSVREKQLSWLKAQSYSDAEYRVALAGAPVIHNNLGYKYSRVLNMLGTDIAIFGGAEQSEFCENGLHNQNYATVVNGTYGVDGTVATLVRFCDGNITVSALKSGGKAMYTESFSADSNDGTALFSDIGSDTWYSKAVNYASSQLLMKGVSADSFVPNGVLTRAMAVTVLSRLADADISAYVGYSFDDVPTSGEYSGAVGWAKANGITNGTSSLSFSPDAPITREQLCAMLYRMFKTDIGADDTCGFADFSEVCDYAKQAVASLEHAGIINGMGDNRFEPKTAVTRAMLAQIIYKANF